MSIISCKLSLSARCNESLDFKGLLVLHLLFDLLITQFFLCMHESSLFALEFLLSLLLDLNCGLEEVLDIAIASIFHFFKSLFNHTLLSAAVFIIDKALHIVSLTFLVVYT